MDVMGLVHKKLLASLIAWLGVSSHLLAILFCCHGTTSQEKNSFWPNISKLGLQHGCYSLALVEEVHKQQLAAC